MEEASSPNPTSDVQGPVAIVMSSDKGQRGIDKGPARVKLCRRVLSTNSSAVAELGKEPANTAPRNIILMQEETIV